MAANDSNAERLARLEERLANAQSDLSEIKLLLTSKQDELALRVAALENSRAFLAGVCAAVGAIAGAGVSLVVEKLK